MSNYADLKSRFIEDEQTQDFIGLANSLECRAKILDALQKPLKLILFYGKPGSGKTFLLHKIVKDLAARSDVLFFAYPFFSEREFIGALCEKFYGRRIDGVDGFENFMYYYTQNFTYSDKEKLNHQQIIILDEAQLYPADLIEKIRLMADSRYFKFLFTIHKTQNEDALAQEHFQTRIWESIELKSAGVDEIRLYLQKRLKDSHYQLSENDIDLANKLCEANLRSLNRLMYKFFEICESYDAHQPSALLTPNFNEKALIMSAIELGVIDA